MTRSLQKRVLFQHMLLLLLLLLLQHMLVLLQLMLVLLQLMLVLADPGSHGATLGNLGMCNSVQDLEAANALAGRHRRARACPRRQRRRARLLLHQHHALSTPGSGAATGGRRSGH